MTDWKFKHGINKVIEGCAEALEKKLGFNPLQVIGNFHLFHMHFFENTPRVPLDEIDDWYYLRDSDTHSAVIYNHETKEVRLADPENYWDEETKAYFRLTEKELHENFKKREKKILSIKRTLAYRRLKPVIEWYFTCPLPFISVYGETSAHDFIKNVLEKYSENFELESDDHESITNDLFYAYHSSQGKYEREQDFIMVGVNHFKNFRK